MKKLILLLLLASGLFAFNLTQPNILGKLDMYTFICDTQVNRVWVISSDDDNRYKVVWVNPKKANEEWLKCTDYKLYASIFIDVK